MGDWEEMMASAERHHGKWDSATLATLQAACETSTPVSVMPAHAELSCAGHLRSASPEGVVLELPHPPRQSLEQAIVAVSFPVAGKVSGFSSAVLGVQNRPNGSAEVTVRVPEEIQMSGRRASVRVPVPDDTVSAAILRGESMQVVQAIDLSLQGVLIEFREGEVPDIVEGHRRMVALKLEGKSILLEAEVRRREGPRYGMAFILRGERPPGLARMVTKLQYLWSTK